MPDRSTARFLWLALLGLIGILAFQFEDNIQQIFTRRGVLTVEQRADHVLLQWRGAIEAPMAEKLEAAFRQHEGDTSRFVLSLHSPGGTLEHGRRVLRVIDAMQRRHKVDTVVADKRACASMCVPIYLAGGTRSAAPGARFMFHEVSFRDTLEGKVEDVLREAISRATDAFFERYLKPFGVNARWLADMRQQIRGKDVWRTARQLVNEGAGIVQQLE